MDALQQAVVGTHERPCITTQNPKTLLYQLEVWCARGWAEALYDGDNIFQRGYCRAYSQIRTLRQTGKLVKFL